MNWDKIEQLLNIVDKSLGHGVKLQGITNAALNELAGHNNEAQLPKHPRVVKADPVPAPEPETETAPVKRREIPEEVS